MCERGGVKKYKKIDWLVREKYFEGYGGRIVQPTKNMALQYGLSSASYSV